MTPIQRLKQHTSDGLTVRQAAEVLGLRPRVIYDLVQADAPVGLECQAHAGSGGRRKDKALQGREATKARPTLSFTRLALLSYLIRCTRGDRATLMAEIEVTFPHWLPLAQRIAKGLPALPTPPAKPASDTTPALRAPNVLPFIQTELFPAYASTQAKAG